MPQGRISWKESNLALIGSDLDHKVKAANAEGEPQWKGLGEQAGLYVWRIEDFRVVPWPKKDYGKFHKGDSYIVLNSYLQNNALKHDVHMWIGSESSQDEYGTAAYKMVEVDESLGGAPIQHRETEGRESPLFLSYFNGQVVYLQGGVASGFNHVEPTVDKPYLYRIKGTEKSMSLTQVELSKSSLNAGDSFILFANPSKVWVWHGSSANPDEKFRANQQAEKMCSEGTVVSLEQGSEGEGSADFWSYLGEGEIGPADELDRTVENFAPLLFRLSPDGEPEQVAKGGSKVRFGKPEPPIPKSALDAKDTFLLDAGWDVFVWIGGKADRNEKISAMASGERYCQSDPRTAGLPMMLVKGGWEPSEFNVYFG